MKRAFIYLILVCCAGSGAAQNKKNIVKPIAETFMKSAYADVNGIKMYYETYGKGKPLVLIHGGGSTIQSTFGRIIPLLQNHYHIIAVELQNHGRSGFRAEAETFEQDAEDVIALLHTIGISKAVFLGFSNGGTTSLLIANKQPGMVERLILIAATYKREGMIPGFFDYMSQATISEMPKELKEAFLKVNNDTAKLQIMFEKDRDRMINFKDYPDELLTSIQSPALIINADKDVIVNEHALKMHQLIKNSRLVILPGIHGKCIGEIATPEADTGQIHVTVSLITEFLK